MKICYWILAVLAVGAFCVDGADARARHPRHRPAADATAHRGDVARPRANDGDTRAGPGSKGAADDGTGVKTGDIDLRGLPRKPKKPAKLAVKPTKSKPIDAAAARRAAERRPRPDLYGNIKNATAVAPAAVRRSAAPAGSAANGTRKAGPNSAPTTGLPAGFSPTPGGTVGRASAAKVLPPPALGAAAPAGPGAGINGTGIARPGVAPGTIGGPAKVATGIAGTGMKPKR
jgi:hypothetical protein